MNKKLKTCPDCGMLASNNKCGNCGWKEKEYADNRFCAYRGSVGECILPGTRTEATRPDENTRWFCTYHAENKNNQKISDKYIQDIKNKKIQIDQVSWRDKALLSKMEELKEKNSYLFYTPTSEEERDEYQQVVMSFLRRRKQKTNLPYDKNKLLS